MAGISSKSAGTLQNKEKTFQGQQIDDDLGLNWIQFKWRNHDPQIGRFIEIDPLAEDYEYNSTYAFSENKVTNHVELEGLEAVSTDLLRQAQTAPPQAKVAFGIAAAIVFLAEVIVDIVKHPPTNMAPPIPGGLGVPGWNPSTQTYTPPGTSQESKVNSTPTDQSKSNKGTIYKVPGNATQSGKPYIGRHNKPTPQQTRKSSDGRDRKQAEVIDTYDPEKPKEGQYKEQKAIDNNGGVQKLDNKRNEVSKERLKELEQQQKQKQK